MIYIDYLQLIRTEAQKSRNESIGETSIQLKMLARLLKIPIIAVAQLNRGVEARPDKRPVMSDLRDSGQIEQDADIIMMLYRDGYYDEDSEMPNETEIRILKNRGGKTGTVFLRFDKEYPKFTDQIQLPKY